LSEQNLPVVLVNTPARIPQLHVKADFDVSVLKAAPIGSLVVEKTVEKQEPVAYLRVAAWQSIV